MPRPAWHCPARWLRNDRDPAPPAEDSAAPRRADAAAPGVQRISDHLRREWQLYVLLLPTILWMLIFLYKPMYGLQIAFKDYSIFRGVAGSPWIGLEHFETLFGNDQFIRALKNTIIISMLRPRLRLSRCRSCWP